MHVTVLAVRASNQEKDKKGATTTNIEPVDTGVKATPTAGSKRKAAEALGSKAKVTTTPPVKR